METVTTSVEEIEQITPFSYRRPPERLSDSLRVFVHSSSDYLHTHKPPRVAVVVATPATKWSVEGHSVTLLTFAIFRKYFTIIEELTPTLVPVYLQSGVLPIIVPVRARTRRHTFEVTPSLMRYVAREGVQLYSSNG